MFDTSFHTADQAWYLAHPRVREIWEEARQLILDGKKDDVLSYVFLLTRSEKRLNASIRALEESVRLAKQGSLEEAMDVALLPPGVVTSGDGESVDESAVADEFVSIVEDELRGYTQQLVSVKTGLSILEEVLAEALGSGPVRSWDTLTDTELLVGLRREGPMESSYVAHLYFRGFIEMTRRAMRSKRGDSPLTAKDMIGKYGLKGRGSKTRLFSEIAKHITAEDKERILDTPRNRHGTRHEITADSVKKALQRAIHPLHEATPPGPEETNARETIYQTKMSIEEAVSRMLTIAKIYIALDSKDF